MIEVKCVQDYDIKTVVLIHKKAFDGFFLTELGCSFLKLYYTSVLKNDRGILLGCYIDGQLHGFCAATVLSNGFNGYLVKRNFKSYFLIGLKLLFTKMNALIRLFRNFSKSSSDFKDDGLYAELLSIGIDPACQGLGLGKKLLIELENEVNKTSSDKLSLTTDFSDNEKAIGFYTSLGYSVYYTFTTYPGRKMYRMIKNIK